MIGVVANEVEYRTVREFFELFKTPWEYYRPGAHYDILLCSNSRVPENSASLLLLYGSQRQPFEESRRIKTRPIAGCNLVCFRDEQMPIYGGCLLFDRPGDELLFREETNSSAGASAACDGRTVVRLGFDLFKEVHYLLTQGQPPEFASIPTLELHISFLRDLIVSKGLPLLEILPVPAGYRFMVCLTHDVDHPRVRFHKCDHTMVGFLYRALIGSVVDFCRGRRAFQQVTANWKAALSLPFVFAGVARDFWNQLDRYLELEAELPSTFFVIPTKDDAGVDSDGRLQLRRAARYALADIADDVDKLLAANREIAVHGIDAWHDSTTGRHERQRIEEITGATETGIRMHWLYFNSHAPSILEKAGFYYDSTVGYNETIGYRAGTAQVFKHPETDHLLELPLHIMDTALFYPSYMNLSDKQAITAMQPLIEKASRLGGVLTVNWHDRSPGPERLWDGVYANLLGDLRARTPWFATAFQIVSWFRKRRAVSFSKAAYTGQKIPVQLAADLTPSTGLPPLTLRVYNTGVSQYNRCRSQSTTFEDFTIHNSGQLLVAA
jgi:hypothetical protein